MDQAEPARSRERKWAFVRLALGFLQVFGASLGAGLLMQAGITKLALVVVLVTGLCTTASVLLFGGRHPRRDSAPPRRR